MNEPSVNGAHAFQCRCNALTDSHMIILNMHFDPLPTTLCRCAHMYVHFVVLLTTHTHIHLNTSYAVECVTNVVITPWLINVVDMDTLQS